MEGVAPGDLHPRGCWKHWPENHEVAFDAKQCQKWRRFRTLADAGALPEGGVASTVGDLVGAPWHPAA